MATWDLQPVAWRAVPVKSHIELGRLILISKLHETNIHTSADHLLHQKLTASKNASGMILDQRRKLHVRRSRRKKSPSQLIPTLRASAALLKGCGAQFRRRAQFRGFQGFRGETCVRENKIKIAVEASPDWSKLIRTALRSQMASLAQIWGTQQLRILHSYTSTAHPIVAIGNLPLGRCWRKA